MAELEEKPRTDQAKIKFLKHTTSLDLNRKTNFLKLILHGSGAEGSSSTPLFPGQNQLIFKWPFPWLLTYCNL
jgi:hypothetical protein